MKMVRNGERLGMLYGSKPLQNHVHASKTKEFIKFNTQENIELIRVFLTSVITTHLFYLLMTK
jgi:hypothetical protein